jgi:hypothetical protein
LAGDKPQYRLYAAGAYDAAKETDVPTSPEEEAGDLGIYDVVVIATPLAVTELRLVTEGGEAETLQGPPREMATTISTFIEGRLREGK